MGKSTQDNDSQRTTSAAVARSFHVLASRADAIVAKLGKLASRASKKGLALRWTVGSATVAEEMLPANADLASPDIARVSRHPNGDLYAMVSRVAIEIEEISSYDGWRLVGVVAALDHGQALITSVPGETVAVAYAQRSGQCDHCHTRRARRETFVLRHDGGSEVLVGKSCLKDYLPSTSTAQSILAQASMIAELRELFERDGSDFAHSLGAVNLLRFATYTVASIRRDGWVSANAAANADGEIRSTAARVTSALYGDDRLELADSDETTATSAIAWAAELPESGTSFEANCRALARGGIVIERARGLAAALVAMYLRSQEKFVEAKTAKCDSYFGTVGSKVEFVAQLEAVFGYETQYGWTSVLRFRVESGELIVWKTSSTSLSRADSGKRFAIKATIKAHEEYRGEKQTTILRAKLEEK